MSRLTLKELNPIFSPVLYRVGQAIVRTLCRVFGRWEIRGREHFQPEDHPVIFAANHRALIDPPLIGSTMNEPLFYFAKESLFRIPLVGWYIRRVNGFPVRRGDGSDVGALKLAMRVLRGGRSLLLFPEGGRRLDPSTQWQARAGVGLLAAKTGVPVIPVGLVNSENMFRFKKVRVSFGRPMTAPAEGGPEAYQQFADDVMRRIEELCR